MAELASRVGMVGVARHIKPVHDRDPKEKLLDEVGHVPGDMVMFNRILVAVYVRPKIEKIGSIFLTDKKKDQEQSEDLWQGKVGLVIAKGPQAYEDDEATKFHGQSVDVGDWVWFRPSDGQACEINGVFCRVFQEPGIIGKVPHPDYVW